jgi:cyclomaltodextrin glucanotransferase
MNATLAMTLLGCVQSPPPPHASDDYYGTTEPFAGEAIYLVMTDRFVNGDPDNDQRDQGGANSTFDRPVSGAPPGESANIGYLGGDFRGVLDHVDYIRDMGFTSVWITPIVDNPDAVFTGGKPVSWGSLWTDQGKTGYHGYWGVNFYKLDEHLPSPGLDFAAFTQAMHAKGMKVVLDIVGNHGSPAFSMPYDQPEFGKVYDRDGTLLADYQNLAPDQLDPEHQPLHRFFNKKQEIAELLDFNENNPDVLAYLAGAYEQWLDQGADAFRIDTIGWMPHSFWKRFADRMRAKRPGLFMFGEDLRWNADEIAPHTQSENGGISVLDFPLKARLAEVFEHPGSDYALLKDALYLQHGPYANPYELVTFYDNHDMPRLNASDAGFIDINNWLFTARGIPAIYYGSEIGFMRGRAEHAGNRNYFGVEGIAAAAGSPIHENLRRIAQLRATSPALQMGLQVNIELAGDRAAFYRVYQHAGVQQIALVLLNKGDAAADFAIADYLESGTWRPAFGADPVTIADGATLAANVPAHGVQVYLFGGPVTRSDLKARLGELMEKSSSD